MPTDTITASGNWPWPVGVTEATVEGVGQGGFGRNALTPSFGWGGGGGGAYSRAVLTKGVEANLVITIGNAAAFNNARVDTTVVQNGVTRVLAKPGANASTASSGTAGGAGGSAAAGTGTVKYSGGAGGQGDTADAYGGGGGGSPLVSGLLPPVADGTAGGAASGAAGIGAGQGGGITQGEGGNGGTPLAQGTNGRDYGGGGGGYTAVGSVPTPGAAVVFITYTSPAASGGGPGMIGTCGLI